MELLLRVSLCLLTFIGKSFGDEIRVITVAVSQGSDAILPCSPTSKEDLSSQLFKWGKYGQNEVFYYDAGYHYNNGLEGQDSQFKGRVSFFQDLLSSGNASIVIQNVMLKDTGIYSCEFPNLQPRSETFQIKLVVKLFVTEGSDVILPCSPIGKDDLTHHVFDWKKNYTPKDQEVFLYGNGSYYNNGKYGQNKYFENRVKFFQDQLKVGNASIQINNTKQNDNGIYSCEFPHLKPPGQKFYIKLAVGTCPKPSFSIRKKQDGGMLVQCEADGVYPEPKMELHDSADVPVEPVNTPNYSNGKYIILQAVVTKDDEYHCVMKQEGICHQIYSTKTLVTVASGDDSGFFKGLVVGVAGVIGVIISVALFYFLCWRKRKLSGKPDDKTNTSSEEETLSRLNKD